MRLSYIERRDSFIPRNNRYNEIKKMNRDYCMEATILKIYTYFNSFYNYLDYIKDRVFHWNVTNGLTNGDYRNFYSELKSRRHYRKIHERH